MTVRPSSSPLAALIISAALALGGCGGDTTVPYPNGPWSAGDQGTFVGACEAGASTAYCNCALGDAMAHYPNTHDLPGSIEAGGITASEHKSDFPDCAGK